MGRWLVLGWVVMVTLVAGCRSFPAATPVAPRANAVRETLELDAASREVGAQLKIHALHTGETLVPFSQFFDGNDGAVGMKGIWKLKTDGRRFWVPVQCFLILHPTQGPILVDTCVSRRQGASGYYEGLAANVHNDDINRIGPGQDLAEQLGRFGLRPEDVRHVVMTHLHEDHVGELNLFPKATVHIAKEEWDHRDHKPFMAPVFYEKNWRDISTWDFVEFNSGRFGPFAASQDLFGDGTVILLPTVGHTMGHTSVAVNAGDHLVVLSGDAFYTLRHLDPDGLAAFSAYDDDWQALYKDSIRRLVQLQQSRKEDVVLVAQHDPFAVTMSMVQPFFSDGRLDTDERAKLLGHQRSLYDAKGKLRPQAMPRFVEAPTDDGAQGRVVAEIP